MENMSITMLLFGQQHGTVQAVKMPIAKHDDIFSSFYLFFIYAVSLIFTFISFISPSLHMYPPPKHKIKFKRFMKERD